MVVPYFGKLPYNFQLWLEGCRYNPTIDWLVITDDITSYDYPQNVRRTYCEFDKLKERIQIHFDFKISLDKAYKLCDFRAAYGEIFEEELQAYDHWGYCDVDVLFGNIRRFITDDILDRYEKVGFQGHLTIYQNTEAVRSRYRTCIDGIKNYREVFSVPKNWLFDELQSDKLYEALEIPVWKEVHYANLMLYKADFYLVGRPEEEDYLNKHQIFIWRRGCLERKCIDNGKIRSDEFMYIHFFRRNMKLKIEEVSKVDEIVIYPNTIEPLTGKVIDKKFVIHKAHCSKIKFKILFLYRSRKKITPRKVIESLKDQVKWSRRTRL